MNARKIVIKDKNLFEKLRKLDDKEKYKKIRLMMVDGDERFPKLEKLDHIKETGKAITFVDVGCSKSGGWISDNTFEVSNKNV